MKIQDTLRKSWQIEVERFSSCLNVDALRSISLVCIFLALIGTFQMYELLHAEERKRDEGDVENNSKKIPKVSLTAEKQDIGEGIVLVSTPMGKEGRTTHKFSLNSISYQSVYGCMCPKIHLSNERMVIHTHPVFERFSTVIREFWY